MSTPRRNVPPGTKFNNWTVVREVTPKHGRRFLCRNSTGKHREVELRHLLSGSSKGTFKCGRTIHGMSRTKIFSCWSSMKTRCFNRKSRFYSHYGGRGITVCKRWLKFENFLTDMGSSYSPGLTLDRINVNMGYYKSNCRWIPNPEQQRNRSNHRILVWQGRRYKAFELAVATGVNYSTLLTRLSRGVPVKLAISKQYLRDRSRRRMQNMRH